MAERGKLIVHYHSQEKPWEETRKTIKKKMLPSMPLTALDVEIMAAGAN